MDDQQMDQWFADKLKKEQEFDFRESDWEVVAEGLDRQEEAGKRRRFVWLWWPLGIAATLILGLFFWNQQQQIIELRKELSAFQTVDTVRKTIIIQDTVRKSLVLPVEQPSTTKPDTDLQKQNLLNTFPDSPNSNDLTTTIPVQKTSTEKPGNDNKNSKTFFPNISNSSVVKGRAQLSAVDSSTESPTFFTVDGQRRTVDGGRETLARLTEAGRTDNGGRTSADGERWTENGGRETVDAGRETLAIDKLVMLVPEAMVMGNVPEIHFDKAPTSKITPVKKWKPRFELDAFVGVGKPAINISGLADNGQTSSYVTGVGLSMQTLKRLWVRAGVSHQTLRYYSDIPDAASAYANDTNSDLELLRDSTQINPAISSPVNSIEDKNQYWQFELGLRYHWLQRKNWGAYVRGDVLSRFEQDRNTEVGVFSQSSNGLDYTLSNKTINQTQKGFSVIGLQLGTGTNYRLSKHWQLSLEGNVVFNTNQVTSSSVLLPRWDLRLGSRFNF